MKKLKREDKLLLIVFFASIFISFYLNGNFLKNNSDLIFITIQIFLRIFIGAIIGFFVMVLFHIIYFIMKWMNYDK
jgi:flagellar biosynthesis protein FliR